MPRPRLYSDEERVLRHREACKKYKKNNPDSKNWAGKDEYHKNYYISKKDTMTHRWKQTWSERAGMPFDLDVEDVVCKTKTCPIFPWIEFGTTMQNKPSVDRTIPEKGYVKGNVEIISLRANRLKSNATLDELIALGEYAKRIKKALDS